MITLALAELRRHPGRAAAVLLAVMISVGFLGSSGIFLATEAHALGVAATASIAQSDVVVEPQDPGRSTSRTLATIRSTAGVDAVDAQYHSYPDFQVGSGADAHSGSLQVNSASVDPRFRWGRLTSGRFPTAPDEIALAVPTARRAGLTLGGTMTLSGVDSSGNGTTRTRTVTVVGLVDLGSSLFAGLQDAGFVAPSFFPATDQPSQYLVTTRVGSTPDAVAAALATRLGSGSEVQTSAALETSTVQQLSHGVDVFRVIAMIFGGIALLVGAMIIVNTFAILVAQRRRQIGLLRVIGAEGSQVRRSLLVEAVVVGMVGALLGIAFGIGVGAAATAVTGSLGSGLVVPWATVLGAAAGGVGVTVLAAAVPARRALRVTPLEALRPVADEATVARAGRLRTASAVLMLVLGAGVVAIGLVARIEPLLAAVAGSLLLAVGILLIARSVLPPVLRLLGLLAGRLGPVGKLASANAVRNPARAAVTCTALMLAVGLIVTLQVGSASVKQTVIGKLNQRYPVDLTVTAVADRGTVPDRTVQALRALPGVAAAVPVLAGNARVVEAGVAKADQPVMVIEGPGADAAAATRSGFGAVTDGVVLSTPFTIKNQGWQPGQRLRIVVDGHTTTLTLRLSNLGDDNTLVVSRTELLRLDPQAGPRVVWASVPDINTSSDVLAGVRGLTGDATGLQVGGSLAETASYTSLLDTLLAIATGLLAVAVIIALIGVGNTLGLSVLERTRESALLRALGLQRRQLRAMLVIEAVLLALVAGLVGTVVGIGFGWLGTLALSAQSDLGTAQFAISASQTATVIGVAVLAGALASVLPARRAARATPVEALAEE